MDSLPPAVSTLRRSIGLAAWISAALLVLWLGHHFQLASRMPDFLESLRRKGAWGMIAFVAAYVVACVCLLPGSLLTLGAGAVFGLARGFMLVSLASTLGATASFLIGRFAARDWVAGRAARHPRFAAIDAAVGEEGWRMVGLLRLSPVFPFNLLNYALGLTRVRLRDYLVASWIGMMPGTLLYVWLGAAAGDAVGLAKGRQARQPVEWVLYAAGLLATVWVTVRITRLSRAALARRIDRAAPDPGGKEGAQE